MVSSMRNALADEQLSNESAVMLAYFLDEQVCFAHCDPA